MLLNVFLKFFAHSHWAQWRSQGFLEGVQIYVIHGELGRGVLGLVKYCVFRINLSALIGSRDDARRYILPFKTPIRAKTTLKINRNYTSFN